MDGMNWFRAESEFDAVEQPRTARQELVTALILTALSVVLAFVFVLALNATGIVMAGEEFSSIPIDSLAAGIAP